MTLSGYVELALNPRPCFHKSQRIRKLYHCEIWRGLRELGRSLSRKAFSNHPY